jgi:hypothetical protein
MKKLFAVLVAIALVASIASAQLKQGAFGIQMGVTGNPASVTGTPSAGVFGGVYNLSQNLRLGVDLGFGTISPPVGGSSSQFVIGAGVDYFLSMSENVSPFIGGKFEFTSTSVPGGSASGISFDVKAGLAYWFSPRFAVSGFGQLGFGSSGPSGGTTSAFGTSMGTNLTLYF